ncbi:MAG TPA: hypothetical protein VND01_00030 [Candidatus Acidoferrales bacterium]|nr:hypothetical protein [Candidatus Acidoferrales bacterium]
MKYQFILQWSASVINDYDSLIAIENFLIENLTEGNEVDGHDAGSDEMNIFIQTGDPDRTFLEVKTILNRNNSWGNVRIAYRKLTDNKYTILWPRELKHFNVV